MSWLAWRLHGAEVRLSAVVATLAAALLVVCRVILASDAGRDVKILASALVLPIATLVIVAPALLGMFLGAPLVATEIEHGTHRLAWAQSVSRRRWLLTHLRLVLCGSVAAAALAGATTYWGLQPLFDLPPSVDDSPMQPGIFDAVAIVPAAYAAFAIALGVALGTLARRTLVAMFAVLVVFTVVRVGIAAGARPYYEPPLRALTSMSAPNGKGSPPTAAGPSVPSGAYIVSQDVLDPTGRDLHVGVTEVNCGQPASCARYTVVTEYQPADRFWTFQLIEAGIYVALGALLLGLTYWLVVRRVT